MAVKAQVTAARTMPTSGGPGAGEPDDRGIASPGPPVAGPVSHPARTPVAGIGWDTVRAPAADAGGAGPGSEASGRAPPVARDDLPVVPCPWRHAADEAVSRDRAQAEGFRYA